MRHYRIIGAGLLLLLGVAACRAEDGRDLGATETIVSPVAATATFAATGTPEVVLAEPELEEPSIRELSDAVVDYIEGREGDVAVAVLVSFTPGSSGTVIYSWRGDERFRLASITKVPIMLAVMAGAVESGRDLSDEELALMTAMITVSDNDSASVLWQEIGGGPAVERYLLSIGIEEIFGDRTDDWGSSLGTATAVARLFGMLGSAPSAGLLSSEMRTLALDLLQGVDPAQSWGVTQAESHTGLGAIVGLKNGWFPESIGWRVHSAALILPRDGHQAYAIAVLTSRQPSKEYGIETIEEVARLLHAELHSKLIPGAPPAQAF